MPAITRRKFVGLAALAIPAVVGIDAALLEPTNLKVVNRRLDPGGATRFVQFSDLHYKGDCDYAAKVVRTINELEPQFVCFTGDLVEHKSFAAEALDFIRQIKAPVYGIPGNHDYWSRAPFADYDRTFRATGGAWLVDQSFVLAEHGLELVGMALIGIHAFRAAQAERRLLLMHYPIMADHLDGRRFDLILAGHSHGGQIRLPFFGALHVPYGVGAYDLGHFATPGGLLYVNAGIGTVTYPYRFNCPPEITFFTI